MSDITSGWGRRAASLLATGALAAGLLAVTTTPAQAAETSIDDATFTWGLNGYAQQGIFGPWTFKDFTGEAAFLEGNVATPANPNPQTEYLVDPVPATSFPTGKAGKSPNAVTFTGGEGTVDRVTGEAELEWDGSYTVNAYPAAFNAPNEIYSDPILTVEADGSGELTMDFTIGAGTSMGGEPFEEQSFGRLTMATFDAGSLSNKSYKGYRVTPDYQGVEVDIDPPFSAQDRTCTTAGGATGWWGSWPAEFLDALQSHESGQSVMAHFYSTGCGGNQDIKPPLPFDVGFPTDTGSVELSATEFGLGQTSTVTVTATGFDPNYAVGTRPPFSGKRSGVYVAFGKFADDWKPSEGHPSSTRPTVSGANGNGVSLKWAVPADSFPGTPPQNPSSPSYVEFNENGSFTAELQVDSDWITAESGNWGIYTYPGGGAVVPEYETFTPISFVETGETAVTVEGPETLPTAKKGKLVATVEPVSGATPVGKVRFEGFGQDYTRVIKNGGPVNFPIPADLEADEHEYTVTYLGKGDLGPSSVTQTLTVEKRDLKNVKIVVDEAPTTTETGQLTVNLLKKGPSSLPGAEGEVSLQVRRGPNIVTLTADAVDGVAVFELPALDPAGVWKARASFEGDAVWNADESRSYKFPVE